MLVDAQTLMDDRNTWRRTAGKAMRGSIFALMVLILVGWVAQLGARTPSNEPSPQTRAQELDEIVVELINSDEYANAIGPAEELLAILNNADGIDEVVTSQALNDVGYLYSHLARYAEAEVLLGRALAIRERAKDIDKEAVSQTLNNIGLLYYDIGRYREAEQAHLRALRLREEIHEQTHLDIAQSLANLAGVYIRQQRLVSAMPLLQRALQIREAELGPNHAIVATALDNLAELLFRVGRANEAEALAKRALAISEGNKGANLQSSLHNLGLIYIDLGRFAEAEPLIRRSLELAEREYGKNHPEVADNWQTLATALLALNRVQEAEQAIEHALRIREESLGSHHPDVAQALHNLAQLHINERRYWKALPLAQRSAEIEEKLLGADHPSFAQSQIALAVIAAAEGDFTSSVDLWRRAIAIFQRRAALGVGDVSHGTSKTEAARSRSHFDGLVKVAHRLRIEKAADRQQLASEMFEIAQWGTGSEAATALTQMAVRSAGTSPGLSALMRDRQDLIAEWQRKEALLVAERGKVANKDNSRTLNELVAQLEAIGRRLSEMDASLNRAFPDYARMISPKPVPTVELQASLKDNEAAVLFLDTSEYLNFLPEETFVWVVTKSDVRWFRSELGTPRLEIEVAALRCGLDVAAWNDEGATRCRELQGSNVSSKNEESLPFDLARAHALYASLFGPSADLIKGKHLLVVPSGALTKLPLQVLVTVPPRINASLSEVAWFARSYSVTILPSVSALTSLRRVAQPPISERPILGFGNPLLDGNQADPKHGAYFKSQAILAKARIGCAVSAGRRTEVRRSLAISSRPSVQTPELVELDQLRIQSPLPETVDELCNVARAVGGNVSDVRVGARATEREVKRLSASGQLAQYRTIHFATHGTLSGQLRGGKEPGLILTPPESATPEDDGYLSASEIASLKLDADWVILSACNTAGGAGQGEAAEALSGLARAFFYAGARALLVSHWEVDSAATVSLISAAVTEMAKNRTIGRAEALRRAMLKVMADRSRPSHWTPAAHPSVWAPFVVVGESNTSR